MLFSYLSHTVKNIVVDGINCLQRVSQTHVLVFICSYGFVFHFSATRAAEQYLSTLSANTSVFFISFSCQFVVEENNSNLANTFTVQQELTEWIQFSANMFIVVLLITLGTLYFIWVKRKYSYWSRRGVPGPRPSFPFGNIASTFFMREHSGITTQKWYKYVIVNGFSVELHL